MNSIGWFDAIGAFRDLQFELAKSVAVDGVGADPVGRVRHVGLSWCSLTFPVLAEVSPAVKVHCHFTRCSIIVAGDVGCVGPSEIEPAREGSAE